jgi:hypothetical protein
VPSHGIQRPRAICAALALVLLVMVWSASCGDSPTSPERYGFPRITITCEPGPSSSTECRAPVYCSDGPCRPGTLTDVTTVAAWTTDDAAVVRVTGPGRLEAVAPGDTLVRARWATAGDWRPVAVFPGTPPLPTYSIDGYIYEGTPAARVPLDGATVEVLTGLAAGHSAISGAPRPSLPEGTPFTAPGFYDVRGVPNGTVRIRVTKGGYVDQEREVTGVQFTGATFYLERR